MIKKVNKTLSTKSDSSSQNLEELEKQFHMLQRKVTKARKRFLPSHQLRVEQARDKSGSIQSELTKARARTARAASQARQADTAASQAQLKKARASQQALVESLAEVREVLLTAQRQLHAARLLDRKLAARAKALEKFEQQWEKKIREEAAQQVLNAKIAAAKRRTVAKKKEKKHRPG